MPAAIQFPSATTREAGEATLREGQELRVGYKKPFAAPPQLVLVELGGAKFDQTPYSKGDFQIVAQDGTGFRIRNNHAEYGRASWATVRWRAEGVLAAEPLPGAAAPAANGLSSHEWCIERIKKAGGTVALDATRPGDPIVEIDLHRTRITDADLDCLTGRTNLRKLNLHSTGITDAGLGRLQGLMALQTLYLNDTPITDAGLLHLRGLQKLAELGLNQTRVSDQGLEQLKGLHGLKQLSLVGARVTAAGLQEFKRAVPNVRVVP